MALNQKTVKTGRVALQQAAELVIAYTVSQYVFYCEKPGRVAMDIGHAEDSPPGQNALDVGACFGHSQKPKPRIVMGPMNATSRPTESTKQAADVDGSFLALNEGLNFLAVQLSVSSFMSANQHWANLVSDHWCLHNRLSR